MAAGLHCYGVLILDSLIGVGLVWAGLVGRGVRSEVIATWYTQYICMYLVLLYGSLWCMYEVLLPYVCTYLCTIYHVVAFVVVSCFDRYLWSTAL